MISVIIDTNLLSKIKEIQKDQEEEEKKLFNNK